MASPPQGLLLDALADQIELDPGQRDDLERFRHGDRYREDIGGRDLVVDEPIHRDDLQAEGEVGRLSGKTRR